MTIKNFLSQSSFWQVNKHLAKRVGIEAALLLSDFIDKYAYLEQENKLLNIDGDLFFYITSEKIEETTTLTYRVQKTCIQKLVEAGFIKYTVKGIPAKQHFAICEDMILQFFNTSFDKNAKLDVAKAQNTNNKRDKELIIKDKDKEERESFYLAAFKTKEMYGVWVMWLNYKKSQHKFSFKEFKTEKISIQSLLSLANNNETIAIQIINQSIANGWKGFFELKNNQNGTAKISNSQIKIGASAEYDGRI